MLHQADVGISRLAFNARAAWDCTDRKRPDGLTIIPWEIGKQLGCDVTVVDALAPSLVNQGSLCNPGTTAAKAEARKFEKGREFIDKGCIYQSVAMKAGIAILIPRGQYQYVDNFSVPILFFQYHYQNDDT